MPIELSQRAQDLLEQQIARYGFASPDEAIEKAFHVYDAHRPTMDSLNALLREAHQSFEFDDAALLDPEDIKQRGRERLR